MNRPDIIMIVLDTQRADRLSCYGNEKDLTPNINRFSKEGVVFDFAVSAAQWTIPSHTSMFTGLYPTAHQVTQSNLRLGPDTPHVAEILQNAGYETVGFCNNPLVGVLDNELKRGFEQFYNYAGSFPNRPKIGKQSWFKRMRERFENFMRRRFALPIQNFFGQSEFALSISLNPWFTPLWSNWFSFKGKSKTSVQDVVNYIDYKDEDAHREKPFFAFLNLMEAHLPFYPPKEYLEKVNPDIAKNPNARKVMQQWNNEAYRWSCPLPEGLTDFEDEVLNTYYDAEVAFQDAFLDKLLKKIAERSKDRETLTIIVGDHGDGIGEHNYFGHAFVAYQELIHVPLIMHWPQKIEASQRVAGPVSTRRIFHTILSAAQVTDQKITTSSATEIAALSLKEVTQGRDVENETVYSEVYPPFNFIKAIADRQPDIVDQFRLNQMRRAIVQADTKLIQVDDAPDEMFNLKQDILEIDSILEKDSKLSKTLNQQLNRMVGTLESQRDNLIAGVPLELEQDPQLLEHLRGLGYID